jgi:hypothetical protein
MYMLVVLVAAIAVDQHEQLLLQSSSSLRIERIAIQWIGSSIHKKLRPSLKSYAVAVVHVPMATTVRSASGNASMRLVCGARLFDFDGLGISDDDDGTHSMIEKLALQGRGKGKVEGQPASPTTPPSPTENSSNIYHNQPMFTATLLLNTTHNSGATTTYLPSNILDDCENVNNIGRIKNIKDSWTAKGKDEDKVAAVLHQLLRHDMFASVVIGTTFLEAQIRKGLPEPPNPMAEIEGVVSEVGNIVKGPVEGVLKPVVKDMGEVISDTVGGVIETTLTPETSGDMNDQMVRSLVPGLTMSLVENLTPTLAQSFPDTMSEALSESMRERLTKSLSLSLEPKLVASLSHSLVNSISLWTTTTVSHTVERGLTRVLSGMLTKSLAHSIAPSLIHTLSHDATQDYYAYMCYHHKVYCQYTSYAPSQVFYASYYASYFSAASAAP